MNRPIPITDELRRAADSGDSDMGASNLMRRAADHIDALNKELRDQYREFQRDARDIAAEAAWAERERMQSDGWGY